MTTSDKVQAIAIKGLIGGISSSISVCGKQTLQLIRNSSSGEPVRRFEDKISDARGALSA
jgi:hypothetical protein